MTLGPESISHKVVLVVDSPIDDDGALLDNIIRADDNRASNCEDGYFGMHDCACSSMSGTKRFNE